METFIKIILLIAFISAGNVCSAQTEHGLLPYSSKLLLNPSFAGFNRSASTWSNMQFFAGPDEQINHSFTITHDSWSDKSMAATAWYFYHGLTGAVNTNHTGAGYTFAKPFVSSSGEFVPSVNLNYWVYTKQWFVHVIDSQLDKSSEPYTPPGKNFYRYSILNPRLGLLWNSPVFILGISASYAYRHFELDPHSIGNPKFNQTEYLPPESPLHLVVHLSHKMRGKQHGLESRPFKASPELVVMYSNQLLLSRAGFKMDQVSHHFALFVQNNFTDNIHGMAGVFGWKSGILNVNLTAGGAYSLPAEKPAFFGEVSFGIVVPYQFTNEINPWAPPDDSF